MCSALPMELLLEEGGPMELLLEEGGVIFGSVNEPRLFSVDLGGDRERRLI
jgi:hypothetical protein